MSSRCLRRARTFVHNGKKILVLKHLEIGAKPGRFESIRVHFEWEHNERKHNKRKVII